MESDAEKDWIATLIAVQEGRPPVPLLDDAGIGDLLRSRPRIAIVGASPNPGRPVHGVMRTLLRAGYEVVLVNPAATVIDGMPCYPTLAEAVRQTGPIELVDVFRRSEDCAVHAREAVDVGARCLWLQQGIASAEAGRIAHEAGLSVVMDRCTAVEHRRLAAHA
ncbi:MAG TPA: CoA-binding protein [Candidatus Limnocylindrales bacterium]|nr:CoA-binding protein [Candidatus Limnocylindrales bacterium]